MDLLPLILINNWKKSTEGSYPFFKKYKNEMKATKQILGVMLIALAITACKNTDYKKTKDGFPYKVFSDGKGEKVVPGSVIRYYITNKLDDSLLGTSYGGPAQWLPIPKDGSEKDKMQFFLEARKGDSILLIQPIDSILAKNPQAGADSFLVKNKGKQIKTYIRITEVYKDEATAREIMEKESITNFYNDPQIKQQKAKDDAELETYLKSKGITTKKTPLGTYVQTLTPGNGQLPKNGEFSMVRYTGKDLNGNIFDTNNKPDGQLLPVQIGGGGVIPGFGEGIKQLSKGEKAILYIPSVIGYGAQGNPPKIAPNQNLMFEIEVVDITDKQPGMPPMPLPDSTRK